MEVTIKKKLEKFTLQQKQLTQVFSSPKYRIIRFLKKIINIVFPKQSQGKMLTGGIYQLLKKVYKQIHRLLRLFFKAVNEITGINKTLKIENKKWPYSIPLISIVIPCFNYGKFIEESIDSVLAQTFQNFEIIVVDGGSNDLLTRELLKNLEKSKTKIYLRTGRHFVGDNRNYGINLANGKYICCLDADDLLKPTYLEKALFFLETYKYDVTYPGGQCFGNRNNFWEAMETSFESMINIGNSVSTVAVFRKEVWERCGGFNDYGINNNYIFEDWEFWVRLLGNGYRFKNIREPLMLYRIHENGLSATSKTPIEEQRIFIYNSNRDLLEEKYKKIRKKNNNIFYQIDNPFINLKSIKTKKRILFALSFMIANEATGSLLRIIEFLYYDFDVTIINTIRSNQGHGSTLKKLEKYTKEIYNLQDFLDNKDEMSCFVMYLIESREIDLIYIFGSELIYSLLPEIKKNNKDIKIIDQLFIETKSIKNNRKYNKIIDLNIAANEKIKNILIKKFNEKIEKIEIIASDKDVWLRLIRNL